MAEFGRDDPLWPGQLATFVALLLYLVLPAALTIGPRWPLPLTEAAVLAALVMATRGGREATRRREIAIALVLLAAVANVSALGFLVHYLLTERQARDADLLNGGESSTAEACHARRARSRIAAATGADRRDGWSDPWPRGLACHRRGEASTTESRRG